MTANTTAVVITGVLEEIFVENLIASYADIISPLKIISTWNDQNEEYVNRLRMNGFVVLQSEYPKNKTSANIQIYSTQVGILYAQNLGYEYICRSRTDIFPFNFNTFLDVIGHLYSEKITVLCGLKQEICVYFLDVIILGPIDKMLKFFGKTVAADDSRPIEVFLSEEYYGKNNLTKEDVKSEIHFCLKDCKENGIEFIWYRSKYWGIPGRTIPMMRIIGEMLNIQVAPSKYLYE